MIEQTAQLKTSAFENVLPFCVEQLHALKRVCLLTLINIEGASPRPLGSQIAVSETGTSVGMITGGCAEESLVKHALLQFDILPDDRQNVLRLGSDSPWVDIRLPCGAGIDVHFSFPQSAAVFDQATQRLAAREPCGLELEISTGQWKVGSSSERTHLRNDGVFIRHWHPQPRILIVGDGPYVDALANLAAAADHQTVRVGPSTPDPSLIDAHCAVVLLMHDHEKEPTILETVLKTDCFYVGALGSRTSHAGRVERLAEMGVPQTDIARIHGPVGLSIGARSPHEIAVAILAEITKTKHQRFTNV